MVDVSDILNALSVGEGTGWEFKSARGGLPASMWETFSAMANTDGGVIGLGIDEKDGKFRVSGLADPAKMKKSFWNTINNRGKVSSNLLTDDQVSIIEVEGDSVMLVEVPRANRRERSFRPHPTRKSTSRMCVIAIWSECWLHGVSTGTMRGRWRETSPTIALHSRYPTVPESSRD